MPRQVLIGTGIFVLCQVAILFGRLLPLSTGNISRPGPDLALCLLLAWMLRRPDQLAAPVIAALFLLEDILLLRPPGLWTVCVLIASEFARSREGRWRDQPFMVEWFRVSILMGAMMLGYRVVQIVFLLPVPALGNVALQYISTVGFYPLVVLAARWLIGLRRVSAAEAEMMRYSR
ncbi:rod shape-determining protein MreD [Paracoccus methylarcula]|uniref:Rod shape-determining protein MreD n=1 Tax=Paracoccus methylarcula TaxID=72022 RepID=A0A3R7PR95_9RHOB|nr:rod shape-determining protein MreD [Paracoccus methylarcula]RNF35826.1 rod shape-determining protein MreD [Paracoccus methylarcula]